jgi:hypothetical protein
MTSRVNNLIVNRPEIMENGLHISVKIPANSINGYRYKVKLADQNVRPYHQIILLKSVVVNTSAQIPVSVSSADSLFALNCDFGNMIGTNYNVTNGVFFGDKGVVVVPINQSQKSTILNLSGGVVFKLNKPILPSEFDIIFTRHDTETTNANLPNTDIYIYMYFEYYQKTE